MKRAIRWILVAISILLATSVAAAVWLWNDPARAFALAMAAGHANAGVAERTVAIDGHAWRVLDSGPAEAGPDAPVRTAIVLHGLGTTAEAMMSVAPIRVSANFENSVGYSGRSRPISWMWLR